MTNPGPVQDVFLNDPAAFQAVANGMGRAVAEALNYVAFHQSMVTRELFPTGGTGQYGISVKNGDGILAPDEQSTPWNLSQRARWMAEDGLRRFAEALPEAEFAASPAVAQAFLWAGYANRTLGENMCEAIIDSGPAEPRETFFRRAEEHFTRAIQTAQAATQPAVGTAAQAGRAAVRVHLGDWVGAASDAAAVPADFAYRLGYHDLAQDNGAQRNRIAYAGAAAPFKTHSVWGTIYQEYYTATSDPRTPWTDTGVQGDGAVECCGPIPFYRQMKYPTNASPINLSTGREMRLIEAEAKLRAGDWQGALQTINDLRAALQVPAVQAGSPAETWTRLKRERGIEFWLEGRRLGDLYRWEEEGTPGELDPREVPGAASHLKAQDLCFPIPDSERETNPNLRG